MQMTNTEYSKYAKGFAPASHTLRDTLLAFLVGGSVCTLGQGFWNLYARLGVSAERAPGLASITLIVIAATLTALHVYDNLARWAGGGTLVPITGFANAMVSPAIEFRSEGLVAGVAAKMFVIAGPVLVYGTLASVLYGLCLVIFAKLP